MIIEFPGTRGEIEESSKKHKYHSSLIVSYKYTNILVDFGAKYNPELLNEIKKLDFILITHAHPDHYIWTFKREDEIDIPVYLTADTLNYSNNKPRTYKIIKAGRKYNLKDLEIKAYKVMHSLNCPAVGYRIRGDRTIVYAPDILDFEGDKKEILKGIDLLIADGSSVNINMVRRKNNRLFGHTMIRTIIGWCKKYGITKLVITHCGKQILNMDSRELRDRLEEYSEGRVDVTVAYDGYRMKL